MKRGRRSENGGSVSSRVGAPRGTAPCTEPLTVPLGLFCTDTSAQYCIAALGFQRLISSQSALIWGARAAKSCGIKKGMIEIVTCRCCGMGQERVYEGNRSGPGCKCSGFWCVISAKCVAHCPGLLSADHTCNSDDDGGYGRTFLYDYRT